MGKTAEIESFIQRLDVIQAQHNNQIDALKCELRAMLPEFHDQARYHKLRAICSSRAAMRAFRDKGGRVQ